MITKYRIHTGAVTDSYTYSSKHSINLRWSRANSQYTMKIILQVTAIPGFQIEMATKRQNLWTAALIYAPHFKDECLVL